MKRRHFLRSATASLALPSFEAFGQGGAPPKRLVFLGFGFGVTRETWFPAAGETGPDYALPLGLKPLERHRARFSIVQGLVNRHLNEAHWGSTFYLTGANRYAEPGQSFHNSVSADQVAAEAWGKETRFASVQLGCENAETAGHGPGLSMAWNRRGQPVAGLDTPVAAYHRLFAAETVPLEQTQAALRQQRSVLDTISADACGLRPSLSKRDTDKLDEYFQSIREIETRMAKEEQWLHVPKRRPEGLKEPSRTMTGYAEIKLMYDLIVAALQTGSTRVVTYRQPVDTLLTSIGVRMSAHTMSHYDPGPRMSASQLRDEKQSELLAHFLDRLAATREPDGSPLLDHTTVSYGSNISSRHDLINCPALVAGRGAGLRLGRHVVRQDGMTPLCNLWLTILRGSGLPVESHGDSTGLIRELT